MTTLQPPDRTTLSTINEQHNWWCDEMHLYLTRTLQSLVIAAQSERLRELTVHPPSSTTPACHSSVCVCVCVSVTHLI